MKVAVKYLICLSGFAAISYCISDKNIGAGIFAVGCFIAYALIEIQDLKILNKED